MTAALLIAVFALSWAGCAVLVRYPLAALLDAAGERSLHVGAIPRSGGLALALAFAAGCAGAWSSVGDVLPWPLVAALASMAALSFADDLFSLPAGLRLVCHVAIAAAVVYGQDLTFDFGQRVPAGFARVLTVTGVVWMVNLYNFMDGMDGFAAAMTASGFGALALLGVLQGDAAYAQPGFIVVAATAGFACFNFPPARLFLGDAGSTGLGLFAALYALEGWQRGLFPLWVPAVLFSPFWIDATWTVLGRLWRREPFWRPHRQHFYQRLVLSGLDRRRVLALEAALMLACGLSVVLPVCFGLGYNPVTPVLWAGGYAVLVPALERRLTAHRNR